MYYKFFFVLFFFCLLLETSGVCSPGTYVCSNSCCNCPPGRYSSTSDAASCTLCSIGTFAAFSGSLKCGGCLPGFYQSTTGGTSCTQCTSPANSYSAAGVCCIAGNYAPYGSTSCSKCPVGWTSSAGASSCTVCAAGSETWLLQNTKMNIFLTYKLFCYTGTYLQTSGGTTCVSCDAGKSSYSGAGICCAAGYYAEYGSTSCR